jgi:hypothetical protein
MFASANTTHIHHTTTGVVIRKTSRPGAGAPLRPREIEVPDTVS